MGVQGERETERDLGYVEKRKKKKYIYIYIERERDERI